MKKTDNTIALMYFFVLRKKQKPFFLCVFNPLEQQNISSERGECFNADWSLKITLRHVRSLRSVTFFH
jgi:hypothetical protein